MINIDAPLNSVSLGQVSVSILRELFKRKVECCIFPVQKNVDLGAYDLEPEFATWIQEGVSNSYKKYSRDFKTLKIWHIDGSERNLSSKNYLFTFHELDSLTPAEIGILRNQEHVFTASDFNRDTFMSFGIDNITTASLGLSPEFKDLDKRIYDKNITSWFIGGKFEKRKAHLEAIAGWVQTFGNSQSHLLQLSLTNPFIHPNEPQPEQIILNSLKMDRRPFFFNFIPFTPKNSEFNKVLNSSDIVIDMSRGESFSLPSFQAAAIGKHAIVHNNTGMKQWANDKNASLVQSAEKMDPWDGKFFGPGGGFNQGKYFNWNMDDYKKKLQEVCTKSVSNRLNSEGLKLQQTHTWTKTVDIILDKMGEV